jgi:fructokinase
MARSEALSEPGPVLDRPGDSRGPSVIVLGGGLSQLPHLYERLPQLVSPHSDHASVAIKPPKWGHASGVRGAARLWDLPDRT